MTRAHCFLNHIGDLPIPTHGPECGYTLPCGLAPREPESVNLTELRDRAFQFERAHVRETGCLLGDKCDDMRNARSVRDAASVILAQRVWVDANLLPLVMRDT